MKLNKLKFFKTYPEQTIKEVMRELEIHLMCARSVKEFDNLESKLLKLRERLNRERGLGK